MDGGSREEAGPGVDLPAAGALGPGASVDSPPSPPGNPPPVDLAMESNFGGWASLEEWDEHLTMQEERLEQKKRQAAEKYRAVWAKVEEELDRKRRFEQHLEERFSRLEEVNAQLVEERREVEKKIEEDRARWAEAEAEQRRRSEELDRLERDLDIREERLRAMRKEQLQKPLLEQPGHDNDKNDVCDWRLVVGSVIVVVSMFMVLLHIRSLLPRDYFNVISFGLAVLWAPCSVVLANRACGRFSTQRKFSYHVSRFFWLCFTIVVIYALYLITTY